MPEAHVALGYYYFWGLMNFDAALKEFAIARKSIPNDPLLINGFAVIRLRQGDFEGSIAEWKKMLDLSPRDGFAALSVGTNYLYLRRYAEAEEYLDRAVSLGPDVPETYYWKAWNYVDWKGDIRKAKLTVEKTPQKDRAKYGFDFEIYDRNFEEALKQVSSVSEEEFEYIWSSSKFQKMAEIYYVMNQPELARKSFEDARVLEEKKLKERPDDAGIHSNLGTIYAGLGLKVAAIREGKLAVKLCPVSQNAFEGPIYVEVLTRIYVMVGEYDTALDHFEYLLSIPYWFSVPYVRIDPLFDRLRSHPRFQQILQKYEQKE